MIGAVKNFFFLSSGEILSKGLGFLTTVLIARRLGVNGFGDLGLVLAVYSYFALLANPGYDTVGARETAHPNRDNENIIHSTFLLKFISAVAAFILLLLFSYFTPFSREVKQLLVLQGLTLFTIPFTFHFYFRGSNKMHVIAVSRVIQSGFYFIAVALGVWTIGDLIYVPLFFAVSNILGLLPLWGIIRRLNPLRRTVPWDQLRRVFLSSITIGASALCVQVYLNIDTVMLGFFRTNREVGLYTGAYKIVTLAATLPNLIFSSYLPYIAVRNANSMKSLQRFVTLMIAIGVPIGCIGFFWSPFLVSTLYGNAFQDAVIPMQILCLNVIAIFLSIAFANPLVLWEKEKIYFSIVAVSALANVLLNIIMIPLFGMLGAAITTVCAELLVAIRAWRALKNETDMAIGNTVLNVVLISGFASVVALCLHYFLHVDELIAGIVFCLLYPAIFYVRWSAFRPVEVV